MHFRHWVHLVHRLFPGVMVQEQFAQKASTDIVHSQLFHFFVLANFCREIKFYLQKKSIRLIRKWADPMRSVGVAVGAKRPDQILFWLWHHRRRNYPNLCRLVGVSDSAVVNIVAAALATRRHCPILQTVSFAVGKKVNKRKS